MAASHATVCAGSRGQRRHEAVLILSTCTATTPHFSARSGFIRGSSLASKNVHKLRVDLIVRACGLCPLLRQTMADRFEVSECRQQHRKGLLGMVAAQAVCMNTYILSKLLIW
jgi:hypothetical protein